MTPLVYVHPIAGGITIALLLYSGGLGLRARNRRRGKAEILRRHSRIAPVAFVLNAVSWVGGILSMWLLRPEMELAASMHVRLGTALVVVLAAAFVCSRRMGSETIRNLHAALGSVALLLAVAQIFYGLQITP